MRILCSQLCGSTQNPCVETLDRLFKVNVLNENFLNRLGWIKLRGGWELRCYDKDLPSTGERKFPPAAVKR